MRHLNKFENFDNDESRSSNPSYPEYNQANRLKAQQYVDDIFSKGAGDEVSSICKEAGCSLPKDESELTEIKEKIVKYFIDNPERIKNYSGEFRTIPYNSGDGVVRTNNIGGSIRESKKPSPGEENSIKIHLTKDEMRLFSKKTQLISLINRNKVTLRDGEVWFNKDDNQTIKILDIFFEIDESTFEEEINESLESQLGFELLSIKRKRDGIIFRVGETYKDLNNHEYTIGSITEGGNGIFYLNATEGGFINALNAIKI